MSAYMVSENCLANIMGLLYKKDNVNREFGSPLLKEVMFEFFTIEECEKEIWTRLIQLNQAALKQRYGEDTTDGDIAKSYQFRINYFVSIYQGLKSLRCFLYQCSEGNIPETKIFKTLDRISDMVAWDIVDNIKEYDNAEWS